MLDLIGTTEASRILDRDKATVTRWVADGRLRPIARPNTKRNSAFLFSRSDIESLAAELRRLEATASDEIGSPARSR